ncbi:holin [Mycobacterium sp. 1245801.1]|uniref:holin n=1 Tax=Mycobacterium sp. 1245801.1 TaxID=1834075 RepID=UPI003513B338
MLAAQSASHAFLGVSGGDVFNLFHLDWKAALGVSGGAALVAVLHKVVEYRIPVSVSDPAPAVATPAPPPLPAPAAEPVPAVAPVPAAAAVPAEPPAADAAPAT